MSPCLTDLNKQSGMTLLEVLIAFLLLTIGSVAAMVIYERQATTVISLTQNNEAFAILSFGQAVLGASTNPKDLNGASITENSAPAALAASTVSPLQQEMTQLSQAQLQWSVVPITGEVCPCTATQTLTWTIAGQQYAVTGQSVVGY